MTITKKLLLLIFSFFIINESNLYINSKGFNKDINEFIDKDHDIFLNYRDEFRELSCQVLAYSKLKHLYEKEIIDPFMKKVNNKKGFLDDLQKAIFEKCWTSKIVGQYIFDQNLFIEHDKENEENSKVNIDEIAQKFIIKTDL